MRRRTSKLLRLALRMYSSNSTGCPLPALSSASVANSMPTAPPRVTLLRSRSKKATYSAGSVELVHTSASSKSAAAHGQQMVTQGRNGSRLASGSTMHARTIHEIGWVHVLFAVRVIVPIVSHRVARVGLVVLAHGHHHLVNQAEDQAVLRLAHLVRLVPCEQPLHRLPPLSQQRRDRRLVPQAVPPVEVLLRVHLVVCVRATGELRPRMGVERTQPARAPPCSQYLTSCSPSSTSRISRRELSPLERLNASCCCCANCFWKRVTVACFAAEAAALPRAAAIAFARRLAWILPHGE